jgi:serine/threonine protein kinase/tetratricopeptide (TPR) repeat protein
MSELDGDVLPLAEAIADGSHVDWDHAEVSATGPDELRVIQQLRLLADLGKAARETVTTWGPLNIRNEVGGGAFGTVYRAWDPRLQREVALKLLKAPHREDPLASAVVKEARLLAQIRHPNVVTVYGADVFDDRVGIWMEFVTGRTLKDMLLEHGPFGADEAVLIGRDLCRALAAVHQRGFLHRDVKAQNVMREAGGRTVLMDFGAGDTTDNADAPLAGSPAYLAPEVLDGQPPTVRSDIYSLGVLLYHLVSGVFPVSAGSLDQFREHHRSGKRRPLTDLRPDLPAPFVRAVERAIAADPAQRPESAGTMEALLDGTLSSRDLAAANGDIQRRPSTYRRVGTFVAAGVLATLIGWASVQQWWPAAEVRYASVAILPFKNLGSIPDGEYFSEGVAADLAGHLATISGLRVISGASTSRFRDGERSASDIGAELGVATVLDGTVTRIADRVRITSQLVDAHSGASLWSQSFDGNIQDIFRLQTEASGQIAVALRGELSRLEAQRIGKAQAHNVEAFDRYLRGRYHWAQRTEESLQRSLQDFQEAIALDSQYALAHSGLADAYTLLGVYGALPRSVGFERALAAASRAIELDPSLAEAHASLGYAQKNLMDWQSADASFRRAIELKPGYAAARHWYAILLTQLGRFPAAIAEIKTAIALDPLSPSAQGQLGATLLMARRYDDAIEQFRKTLQLQPRSLLAYRGIAQAYTFKGLFEEAVTAANQANAVVPVAAENQELKGDWGYLFAASGRHDEALGIARELTERYNRTGEEVATIIAAIYTGLGQGDTAFDWLHRALKTGDPELGYIKVEPRWDSLREDPRFAELLGKLGLVH